jgi:gliding-associated putative ABC transporter substrate-binding component GldG
MIASKYFFRIDLTEDQHFSLASSTKNTLKNMPQQVYIEVFLDGELTPDYQRLKNRIKEKLEEFSIYSKGKVQYKFSNPNAIDDERLRAQYAQTLLKKGVEYRYERIEQDGKLSEQLIFPSAMLYSKEKEVPILFLKGNKSSPIAEQINQSEEVIEYHLLMALRQIEHETNQYLGIIDGHGELSASSLADISSTLSNFYGVSRLKLTDSTLLDKYQMLLIASPQSAFSEQEKFLLDQYVQRGGSLLFFIEPLQINTDSLMNSYTYALPKDLNISDLLFKWGVRCNPDAVKDMSSGLIKVATGNMGQMQTINWYFHPVVFNFGKHSTVKNLDAITTKYPSSIDTVKATGVVKTPLLFTSDQTQLIAAPAKIDLNEARQSPDKTKFQSGRIAIAYLLEGDFKSLYSNRPAPIAGRKVYDGTERSKIIICTDADIVANEVSTRSQRPVPLGFDKVTNYQFSNKEFVVNAVDYLMNHPLIELRNKEIKLRPLDKDKIVEEKFFWQFLNLGIPPILLIIFGLVRNYWRKRKYNQIDL